MFLFELLFTVSNYEISDIVIFLIRKQEVIYSVAYTQSKGGKEISSHNKTKEGQQDGAHIA
jgi:hypothetical protein